MSTKSSMLYEVATEVHFYHECFDGKDEHDIYIQAPIERPIPLPVVRDTHVHGVYRWMIA